MILRGSLSASNGPWQHEIAPKNHSVRDGKAVVFSASAAARYHPIRTDDRNHARLLAAGDGVQAQSGMIGLFLLMPSIFLASIIFDRGSGFYATILSTALSIFLLYAADDWALQRYLLPHLLFFLLGLGLATISDGMRKALEKAVAAERATAVMIQELNHRVRNNFSTVASMLRLQMRLQADEAARSAFDAAVGRVQVIASAHDHLSAQPGTPTIDIQEYLSACCQNLGDTLRDVRPIAMSVSVPRMLLPSDKAVVIGLLVNELVTNAFKYAFPDERGGTVAVWLDAELKLVVEDDGKGCPEDAKEGLGSRIIRLLVQQLRGTIMRGAANSGCRVLITLPLR
jgi:two-component sensor histidine kinase